MLTVFCPQCGKETPESAAFCANCGMSLNRSQAEAAPAEAVVDAPCAEQPTPADPAVPVPSPAPAPSAKPPHRTPVWWRVLRCLFSIPLTVLLTGLLIGIIAVFGVQNFMRASTLENMLSEMNFSQRIAEEMSNGETDSLAEAIYDDYYKAAVESDADIVLTESELSDFFEKSTFDDFLAKKGGEVLSSLLKGENNAKITKDEILDLVEDNEKVLEKVTGGHKLTDNDYAMLEDFIDENNLEEQLNLSKIGLEGEDAEDLTLIQSAYSSGVWLLCGATLVLLLLLALCNLRGRFLTSLYSGIALLIAGLAGVMTFVAQSPLLSLARANLSSNEAELMEPVVKTLLSGFWVAGLVALACGVVCIALFAVVRICGRKVKK